MHIGLVGLGRMGNNMRARLRNAGIEVTGYDANPAVSDVASLAELATALPEGKKLVWVMVPHGKITDDVITGAPVSGMRNGRLIALVPTAAGLMWWDAARQVVDMHAPPFQAKPDVPRLLHWPAGD